LFSFSTRCMTYSSAWVNFTESITCSAISLSSILNSCFNSDSEALITTLNTRTLAERANSTSVTSSSFYLHWFLELL
ncbi:hypothetical protein L9F63_024369, partial [Diploptera punctata]